MRYLFGFLFIVFLWSCNKSATSAQYEEVVSYPFKKEGTLTIKDREGNVLKTIDIEIAENAQETAKGLMNRDSMAENQGMLFLMEKPEKQTFYMKNTRIPLDLVYVSADSVIVDIQQGIPYSEKTIPSDTISQYVLELNKGMAAKWGIKENETKVSWKKD